MNFEELRGLSSNEAIQKAADWAGTRPEVLDRMWAKESNRGTHPTMIGEQTRWGTAKGHFQQLDTTVNTWSERLGRKFDPFDFTDGLSVAAAQMRENLHTYGGDERKAVMAYHGGPDQRKWGKRTQAYADAVLGPAEAPQADVDPFRTSPASIHAAYAAQPQAVPQSGAVMLGQRSTPTLLDGGPSAITAQATANAVAATEARSKFQEDATFGTQVGAAYREMTTPVFRAVSQLLGQAPERGDTDWNFRVDMAQNWEKYEAGFEEHEREKLRDAANKKDYDLRVGEILTSREEQRIIGAHGISRAMGASVIAGLGDPTTWAVGVGATKAFALAGLGATQAVRAGRPVAAALSVAGESVVGNVAYEGLIDLLGEYRSPGDYAVAAVTGLIPAPVMSRHAYKAATDAALHTAQIGAVAREMERQAKLAEQAQVNVGPGAAPQALEAELRRLETAEINERVQGSMQPAPEADRIPAVNLEEADLSVPQAEPSIAPAPATVKEEGASMRAYPSEGSFDERLAWHNENLQRFDAKLDVETLDAKAPGVHLAPSTEGDHLFTVLSNRLAPLVREYLPNDSFTLVRAVDELLPGGSRATPDGLWMSVTGKSSVVAINPRGVNPTLTAIHELGHAIETRMLKNVDRKIQQGVYDEFNRWLEVYKTPGKAQEALAQRGPLQRLEQFPGIDKLRSLEQYMQDNYGDDYANYIARFREFMAEQFNKNIEAGAVGVGDANTVKMAPGLIRQFVNAFEHLARLFVDAIKRGFVEPKTPIQDFFAAVRERAAATRETQAAVAGLTADASALAMPTGGWKPPQMTQPAAPRIMAKDWDVAVKYGLDKMPQSTPIEKAEFKAVVDIYRKAEAWVAANPRDDARVRTMLNTSVFQGAALTGSLLALSDNPVARMMAGTLLENATGSMGRRSTAALAKFAHEQVFIGNALNEYDGAFKLWAQVNGHNAAKAGADRLVGGELYPSFNKQVAREIEQRRKLDKTDSHPAVKRAADAIEASYERMRKAQVDTKTVGWARLPDTAKGYMTHVISKERMMTLTDGEQRAFIDLLTEQFQQYEGFDHAFSVELARKYLDHARVNALGGHEIPANIHNPQAADMVRGALEAMGMAKDQVSAMMARYAAGGASHTKKRLELDLNRTYPDGQGGEVQLLDLFETDQLQLLRNYSRRVSGEVALAQFGVMGSQGLALLRRSLMFGNHGKAVEQVRVLEAFDQVGAEFLGRPFGDNNNKWMDRALTANAVARLGGMVFNQIGETINMFTHLGAAHALSAIGSMPRLRAELVAAAKGQPVKDGILASLEQWGGTGEFGSEGYKLVMPFDEPNSAYRTYGSDTVTTVDRALRGAGHVQGVLSGWRMVHAVQTRAAAEQITLKALRYIRDGLESKALDDMGINVALRDRIKAELPNIATYDGAGRIKTLDITKATDPTVGRDFALAVLRGSRQIIQGTFIGESGKWAHEGWLKLFAQFRTFGLVSMEKQWARQKANHGVVGVLGMLVGAMAAAAPLYYARVAWQSIGRPDQEEFLNERLSPLALARATLNYVPMAGLAPDVIDGLSTIGGGLYESVSGEKLPAWAKASGGRAGQAQPFIGGVVAPAAGYVDDVWKAAQDLDNPHKAALVLPGSRLWWLAPAINGLRPE